MSDMKAATNVEAAELDARTKILSGNTQKAVMGSCSGWDNDIKFKQMFKFSFLIV
jgi:hypothetical protein